MGMDYKLVCENDKMESDKVEFSITSDYVLKHPDEAEDDFCVWVRFLAEHSGHKIHLIDSRGNETKPNEITGGYVLGLETNAKEKEEVDYDPSWDE